MPHSDRCCCVWNCLLAGGVAIVGVGMSLGAIITASPPVVKRRLSQAGGRASKEQKAARRQSPAIRRLHDPDAPGGG